MNDYINVEGYMLNCTIFSKYLACLRRKSEPFSTKHTEKAVIIITSPNSTGRVCEWKKSIIFFFFCVSYLVFQCISILPLQSLPLSGYVNEQTSMSIAADSRGESVPQTLGQAEHVLGRKVWHQGNCKFLQCSDVSLLPLPVLRTQLQKKVQ